MSTAPTPLRATTVAGAILAVIFIALSAVVGGINVWRTHAAETFTSQAEQAQSDKASIDQAIKDAKTRLDSVNVDASAAAWCDSVTRGNASSMRDIIKRLLDTSRQGLDPFSMLEQRSAGKRSAHPVQCRLYDHHD